jgi:hypothetical protein
VRARAHAYLIFSGTSAMSSNASSMPSSSTSPPSANAASTAARLNCGARARCAVGVQVALQRVARRLCLQP